MLLAISSFLQGVQVCSFTGLRPLQGKFYELFEMDAHVGAEVLGLMYMRVSFARLQAQPDICAVVPTQSLLSSLVPQA